jgi:hypothetical protein
MNGGTVFDQHKKLCKWEDSFLYEYTAFYTPVDAHEPATYLNWEAVSLETAVARDSLYLDDEACLHFKKSKISNLKAVSRKNHLWIKTMTVSIRRPYKNGMESQQCSFYPLKSSGQCILPCALTLKTLHSAHTVYLCVPYGSHNKQRLFPQTALTGWAL